MLLLYYKKTSAGRSDCMLEVALNLKKKEKVCNGCLNQWYHIQPELLVSLLRQCVDKDYLLGYISLKYM